MSDGIEKPESEAIQGQVAKPKAWLAGLLAVLVPGLGHLYLGLYKQAAAVWAAVVLTWNLGILLLVFVNWGVVGFLLVIFLSMLALVIPLVHVVVQARRMVELKSRFNVVVFAVFVAAWFFLIPYAIPMSSRYHAYNMPTSSMEDALEIGDRFFADHSAFHSGGPQRGDIIIFIWPGDQVTKYIKRCVGLPGDTVSIVDKQLFINGKPEVAPATAKHLDQRNERSPDGVKPTRDNSSPFVVPSGHYYCLGDNRDNSYDSRFWGPIPTELILGKAIRIYWSSDLDRVGMAIK